MNVFAFVRERHFFYVSYVGALIWRLFFIHKMRLCRDDCQNYAHLFSIWLWLANKKPTKTILKLVNDPANSETLCFVSEFVFNTIVFLGNMPFWKQNNQFVERHTVIDKESDWRGSRYKAKTSKTDDEQKRQWVKKQICHANTDAS